MWAHHCPSSGRAIVFLFDDRVKIDIQKTKNNSTFRCVERLNDEKCTMKMVSIYKDGWVSMSVSANVHHKICANEKGAHKTCRTKAHSKLLHNFLTVNSKCNCIIYLVQDSEGAEVLWFLCVCLCPYICLFVLLHAWNISMFVCKSVKLLAVTMDMAVIHGHWIW